MAINFNNEMTVYTLENVISQANRESATDRTLVFNMGDVSFFDIDALLLYTCYLKTLYNDNVGFKIGLPNKKKVRDFLKRWRFFETLIGATKEKNTQYRNSNGSIQELVGKGVEDILYNKKDFLLFKEKPEYYSPWRIKDENNAYVELLSRQLLEIKNFMDYTKNRISRLEIDKYIKDVGKIYIIPIIQRMFNVDDYCGVEFSRTLLNESLLNVFEHPKARIALIGMARKPGHKGGDDEFIIGIADNGQGIAETLRAFYQHHPRYADSSTPKLNATDDKWIVYATEPGTTSLPWKKPIGEYSQRGYGLYFLKERTTRDFKGSLVIRSGDYCVEICCNGKKGGKYKITPHLMPNRIEGNLISLHIPLPKKAE